MRRSRYMGSWITCGALALALFQPSAAAQQKEEGRRKETGAQASAVSVRHKEAPSKSSVYAFVSSEMTSFDGHVVTGRPFSAEAVSETIQTLADGNWIMRSNTSRIYRDGQGRTRKEAALGRVGSFAVSGAPGERVYINDPVAGINYVLDPEARTAHRVVLHGSDAEAPKFAKARIKMSSERHEGQPSGFSYTWSTFPKHAVHSAEFETTAPQTYELGEQILGGVVAKGTRTVVEIPAGAIGNERPIQIVSERWYSADLDTVVMTRHNDPRVGETIYRLQNVDRGEPHRVLFKVPSDYTLVEQSMIHVKPAVKKP